MENFQKFIFRGIKTIYLISSTFLLFKVINEHLILLLESGFSYIAARWQFSNNGKLLTLVAFLI